MKILQDEKLRKRLAKAIALNCFRNSKLEDLHSGVYPSSKTGDYSDVEVDTPFSKIPWKNLSRFDDEEMKELMINVVDQTYTFLTNLSLPEFRSRLTELLENTDIEPEWNEPELIYPTLRRCPGNYDSSVEELDPREPKVIAQPKDFQEMFKCKTE